MFLILNWIGFGHEGFDGGHGFLVRTACKFANVLVADTAVLVNQIRGWPVALVVSPPGQPVIVDGYRVSQSKSLNGVLHIVDLALVGKFWIMNADDGEVVTFVLFLPFLDPRNRPLTVNSAKGPEL